MSQANSDNQPQFTVQTSQATSPAVRWVGRVLTVLVVLPFVMGVGMLLSGSPQAIEGMNHSGWTSDSAKTVAILECLVVLLYLIPPLSILGAILMTGYLGGAVATHLRIGESAAAPVVFGVLAWLALFLREPRLRTLIPVLGRNKTFTCTIEIAQPREKVFAYLRELRNFENWNPFTKNDSSTKMIYTGTDGTPGFVAAWAAQRAGSGEQEIARVIEGERIDFELRFLKPFQATERASFAVAPGTGSKTKVIWTMESKPVFPMTIFGLIMNVNKMMSKMFCAGLADLKEILERV